MARFTLQRVLDLKKRREEAMALRLAEARAGEEVARRYETEIEELRSRGRDQRVNGAVALTVGQLQNASYIMEHLDARLNEARTMVRSAEQEVSARLSEFTSALQERRVLDRLREKRLEAANAEELRVDQANMDSIALSRFVRNEKSDQEGDS